MRLHGTDSIAALVVITSRLTSWSQATGVDVYFGRAVDETDDDDDNEDHSDDSSGNGEEAVQEYVKKRWNLNTSFKVDRSEDRLGPESFDLINSRLLAGGINANRWPEYIRELKSMLKRGGWLQMVEIEPLVQSSNGRLNSDSFLHRWWQWYSSRMQQMDKNPRIGRDLGRHLQSANFSHIRGSSIDLPIGSWKTGIIISSSATLHHFADMVAGQESIGEDNLVQMTQMLLSWSLWPLMRLGGMSSAHYRALISGAIGELRDPSKKLYYKV